MHSASRHHFLQTTAALSAHPSTLCLTKLLTPSPTHSRRSVTLQTGLVDLDISVDLVHEHGGSPHSDGPAYEEQRHAEEQHVSEVERHLQ